MYRVVTEVGGVREYLSRSSLVAFDFETAPDEQFRSEERAALDPHKAHIVGVSFSTAEGDGIYIPIAHKVGANAISLTELWQWMTNNFFLNKSVVKIAHNLAFESAFLYARGIVIQGPVYDTIAAAQMTLKGNMAFRTLSDSGLKTLVPELLGDELPGFSEVTGGRNFDELDSAASETIRYACAENNGEVSGSCGR